MKKFTLQCFLVAVFFVAVSSFAQQATQRSYLPVKAPAAMEASGPVSPLLTGPENTSALFIDESFESTTFPPTGWTKLSPDGGSGWNRQLAGTTPVPGFQGGSISAVVGSAVAFCTWSTGGVSSNDQWLVTPQITGLVSGDSLTFWLRKFGNYNDTVDIKISTSGNQVANFTINLATLGFAAADSGWVRKSFSLGTYVGQSIYIAFRERIINNSVDGASFSLDKVQVGTPAATTYCTASAVCDEFISNVTVGTINNTTTCGAGGYSDFTTMSVSMAKGVGYPISVTNGFSYTGDSLGIWVDWNQNGNFLDDGVIAVSGGPASFTATITPPATAILGSTRMRIRLVYDETPVPCGTLDYGEAEDYTVMVTSQQPLDAGILSIEPLPVSSGNHPIRVTIKNYGTTTLTAVTIGYSLNGIAGPSFSWTGSIASLATAGPIAIDTTNIPGGSVTIKAWTSAPNGGTEGNLLNDTATRTQYFFAPITVFPYNESFESGFGNWAQSTADDFNWDRLSGPTSSLTTGPDLAFDGTYYLYTESSLPVDSGNVAILDCPFNFTSLTAPKLTFWYHMYGASMGTLYVDAYYNGTWHNGVWSMTGDKGNTWFLANVSLIAAAGYSDAIIRFRGIVGSDGAGTSYWSDMAIDKITVEQTTAADLSLFSILEPVSGPLTATEDIKISIYNNGSTAISNFQASYQVNAAAVVSVTVPDTVAPGAYKQYTFAQTANMATPGAFYNIKAWVTATGDNNHTNDTLIKQVQNLFGVYCTASGGCDEYISHVILNTINNLDDTCKNYSNYTNLSTTLVKGNIYPITVINGNPYSGDQCGIWIDWNKNGDFTDDDSIIVSGNGGVGPYTANIMPLASADTGATRMRIRITYTGAVEPCGTATYGEVEDYTVVIAPGVATNVGTWSINMNPILLPGNVIPSATVINSGSVAQTFTVTCQIGAYTNTQTVTNLAAYTTQLVSFGNWAATSGVYNVKVFTTLAGDTIHANDTLYKSVQVATNTARRLPLVEEFTSSTCGPCYTFNTNSFNPWLVNYSDSIAQIRYQMNWPGIGDPYYTAQGGTRRMLYGVNAVPNLFVEANDVGQPTISELTALYNTAVNDPAYMKIEANHTITGTNITVSMSIIPYITKNLIAYIVVVEDTTVNNKNSQWNGEPHYQAVMMRMLPSAFGTPVPLVAGQVINVTESYNMANTFMEDINDLSVVCFVQDTITKEVYQAVMSSQSTVGISDLSSNLAIYPNPGYGLVKIEGAMGAKLRVFSSIGELVYENARFEDNKIDLRHLTAGTYLLQIMAENGSVSTHKLILLD